jgi:hypothetical protein
VAADVEVGAYWLLSLSINGWNSALDRSIDSREQYDDDDDDDDDDDEQVVVVDVVVVVADGAWHEMLPYAAARDGTKLEALA